ncbi:nuclear body protein SP140-like [Melanotaenia boesemani]|uniref:nuclear body protein SP140-like n=1 Tax=Melanotaenia boesemani TaxID=1250792 RepID=UPI001C03C211|nr:nuclear body protein SP140-like [Melanotaenia boesemani]
MDPLDFLEPEELLQFFHCHKTEMSCMENPRTFLSQLKDYNLITEDRYKKVSRMKSKENMKKAVYEILDWLEREQSQHIDVFWKCVFKDIILTQYPTLKMMRNSLLDGSFQFDTPLPERVEKEERDKKERLSPSENKEKQAKSEKKKRKLRSDDDEQPGPSAQLTPGQRRKSKKLSFSSPLKKGEKGDIWTWPLYKSQLPVKCGDAKGTLQRDRLAKGEKCIVVDKKWFTPAEFERLGGKGSCRNWKLSIRCQGTLLGKLIKDGHLKTACYKRKRKQTKQPPPSSNCSTTESTEEEDEEEERSLEELEDQSSSGKEEESTEEEETEQQGNQRFKVTCGALSGTLHQKRFASGTQGKSIRTETAWMSPVEFLKAALSQPDVSWRRNIIHDGKPVSNLIEANILRIHSPLCDCSLCKPDQEDLANQKNDDECCICKSEEEGELVVCDCCPCSFHPCCHLPYVEDSTLRDNRQWICTFCIFKENQAYRYKDEQETEAVMFLSIAQHMLECQYLLMYLFSTAEEQIFATYPRFYSENRPSFMTSPSWLGSVTDKLQGHHYQTVGQFVSDIRFIFTNCATNSQDDPELLSVGDHLKKLFDGEFKKAFNICSSAAD